MEGLGAMPSGTNAQATKQPLGVAQRDETDPDVQKRDTSEAQERQHCSCTHRRRQGGQLESCNQRASHYYECDASAGDDYAHEDANRACYTDIAVAALAEEEVL